MEFNFLLTQVKDDEKKAVVPLEQSAPFAVPEHAGNLFQELHDILTNAEETPVDEQIPSSTVDPDQLTLHFR